MTPDLSKYSSSGFSRGVAFVVECLWQVASGVFVASWLPGSALRCTVLRLFGASIGSGVVIKPRVRIKFPWRLSIGDHTWLGESAWIDNLVSVTIGRNVCISQAAYLCTGSHRWDSATFDLDCSPILIEDGAWVAAYSVVGPGVTIGSCAVLALGSVALKSLDRDTIYKGNPAAPVAKRVIGDY